MDATSNALSGLRAASTQLGNVANNIANANTPGFKQQDVNQSTDANGGVETQLSGTDHEVDTDQQLVKADIATYNFKANLTVLKKQDEMTQSLLDIKA